MAFATQLPKPKPAPGAPRPAVNTAFATGDPGMVNIGTGGGPSVMPPATPAGGGVTAQAFPASQPAAPAGAQLTKINPAADLRSQQITPGADPRLATSQAQTDTAAGKVAGFSGYTPFQPVSAAGSPYVAQADQLRGTAIQGATSAVPGFDQSRQFIDQSRQTGGAPASIGGFSAGAGTDQVRGQLPGLLSALTGSPNRSELANQAFQLLREQSQPAFEQDLQGVGRKAAAFGRVGAGMTTSELGDVTSNREKFLGQQQRGLSLDAAGQELNDRVTRLGAGQGLFSALQGADQGASALNQNAGIAQGNLGLNQASLLRGLGQDTANLTQADRSFGLQRAGVQSDLADRAFGQGASLRGEDRSERNALLGQEQAGLDANRGVLGDLAGVENLRFGQGVSGRNELRGERDFQSGAAQGGIDNAVRQRLLEDQLLGSSFGRQQGQAGLLADIGFGEDPTRQLNYQGANQQGQADQAFGGVGDLLSQYLLQQGTGGMGPATASQVIGNPTPKVAAGSGEFSDAIKRAALPPRPQPNYRPAPTQFPGPK